MSRIWRSYLILICAEATVALYGSSKVPFSCGKDDLVHAYSLVSGIFENSQNRYIAY